MPIIASRAGGSAGGFGGLGAFAPVAGITDAGAYFPLGEFTLAASQTEIEFTNIPQTYTHLQIRYIARGTRAATGSQLVLRYNGFTSGYTRHRIIGDGSTATANGATGTAFFDLYDVPGSTATANTFGAGIIDVLDYKNTNKLKTFRLLHGDDRNGSGAVGLQSTIYTGVNNTNAITSIKMFCNDGNLAANSSFSLYGVLA
jgi:hypothetical protein